MEKEVYMFRAVGYAGGCILVAAKSEKEAQDYFDKYMQNNECFSPDFVYCGVVKGLTYKNDTEEPCVIINEVYVE